MNKLRLVNFNEICRLCLVKGCEMSSIFTIPYPSKITSVASVEIYEGDGLPALICRKCCIEVERSYEFKVMCQNSDASLRQCIENNPSESENEDGEELDVHECFDMKDELTDEGTVDKRISLLRQPVKLEADTQEVINSNVQYLLPYPNEASSSHTTENLVLCNADHVDSGSIEEPNCKSKQNDKDTLKVRRTRSGRGMGHKNSGLHRDGSTSDNKSPFLCTICSKSFLKRDNLKKHEIIHRGEKPYLCEECGKSFARKQDLNVHRRYHSGVRPYACSLCNKTFHSYSGLKSHENRHNGVKPFLCNKCGKTFVQRSQLTNHERVHNQEKPYACTLCEKTFTTLTNLKTHQKRHTGINEFTCGTCNRSFFTKSGLERHELLHTGHRAFPCELCKLAFFTKSEITRHMRYHKGEKRFTCGQCNKSFIENQHLIIHERIHTGERPYLCQLCKKSFYTKSKLNRHMRTHTDRNIVQKPPFPEVEMDPGSKQCETSLPYVPCHWTPMHVG